MSNSTSNIEAVARNIWSCNPSEATIRHCTGNGETADMATDHESLMKLALREAAKARDEGNPGFGAVLVENGEVIAHGRN